MYGTHLVRCSTALAGDEYSGNDVCSTFVRSRWHDVAVLEILAPTDTVPLETNVSPRVKVRNNGTQTETFQARFRVQDLSYDKLGQATVLAETTAVVSFSTLPCTIPGCHAMSCTLDLAGDQDESNDIVTDSFFVTGTGVAECEPMTPVPFSMQTVTRGVLFLPKSDELRVASSELLDIAGRKVLDLRPGANDVRTLVPGVYFVRSEPSAASRRPSAVTKVVVTH